MDYFIVLPLKYQVMLGAGAPSAVQEMVASLPSSAVKFAGGSMRIGTDAAGNKRLIRDSLKFKCKLLSINVISFSCGRN